MNSSLKRKSANPGTTTATRRSKRLKKSDKTTELDTYISRCRLSDDDPGLLLSWNFNVLQEFVMSANALGAQQPPMNLPLWLTSVHGGMSVFTFQDDVITYL